MDLNKLVNESLAKIQQDGFVQKVVEKQLKSTIESIVDDLFRSYSDFGKNLKKEIESQLKINLNELNLAGYNVMVLNAVKEKLDEAVTIQGVEKIQQALDAMLGDVKKEYKLSELIKKMKEESNEYGDHNGEEISFHIDSDRRILTFISFDEEDGQSEYECKYRLSVSKDGKVTSVKIGNKELKNSVIMGGLYGLDETLFKIYASGAKLIIDEDDVNLEYGYGDEDE
ncbi:hypothetical protein [Pelosinus baikalensis]|uniref:Uncharacterized protein n=1 Tax=Pelosinus baikalensis TaxID=2892015 RepID=A0ABS8HUJ9_9FIRM|nr:hypothetical protein [Pelosinus baikalensis]MCC5465564.1 hypothetical protein [Pelosinus baikalensis]